MGKSKKENRVKCWLCDRWVLERQTEKELFNGIEDSVCITCRNALRQQDESKEREMEALKLQEEVDAETKDGKPQEGEFLDLRPRPEKVEGKAKKNKGL